MANPTYKAPEINKLLSSLLGVDREKTIKADICTFCGKPAVEFRDELSRKENRISGGCQVCQDALFGV
jgi:coenzyme F420-reducing hydrogenase beta subunit